MKIGNEEDGSMKNPVNSENVEFITELTQLFNKYSIENESNTPDYMLTDYILGCLENYNRIINKREKWYGR